MAKGDAGKDRKDRLAQALRANLRLRKQAAGEEMARREDRLEPRIGRNAEDVAEDENHSRKP